MPQKLTLNSLIDALRSQYEAEKDRICQEELQILGKKKIIEYQGGYPLLEQELTRRKYAGEGMSAGLYEPDADEARIADAIADTFTFGSLIFLATISKVSDMLPL